MYKWHCSDQERECWSYETPVGVLYFDRATWLEPLPGARWRCFGLVSGSRFLPGTTPVEEVKRLMLEEAVGQLRSVVVEMIGDSDVDTVATHPSPAALINIPHE